MKRIGIISFFLAFCFSLGAQAEQFDLIESNEGYQKIKITDPEYKTIIEQEAIITANNTSPVDINGNTVQLNKRTSTQEVVVVKSLRGVFNSDLPDWLKAEFLEEAGYSSWSDVSEINMDETIDTSTIDLDALSMVNVDASSTSNGNIGTTLSLCKNRWKEENKIIQKKIGFSEGAELSSSNSNATINSDFKGNGQIVADIHYRVRKSCGIPIRYQFRYMDVNASIDGQSTLGIEGSVNYKAVYDLFRESIHLMKYEMDGWFYFVQYRLALDFGIDYGAKLEAEASVAFKTLHGVDARLSIDWHCTNSGCEKIRDDKLFELSGVNELGAAVQVKVKVIPYVDSHFSADFDIYWTIDIAEATLGVVASAPVTVFGYYGNLCSDANGDGINEIVRAGVVDVSAEVYAYLDVILGSKKISYDIDLNIGGWNKKSKEKPLYHRESKDAIIYSKNLYYSDLIGSSVMEPVIQMPDVVKPNGGAIISKRSCYPFAEELTFEIDWGDGSETYIGQGGLISHNWPYYGSHLIRARIVTDDAGRDFDVRWVTKTVNVSLDGQSPYYPWLVPIITNMLLN